MRFFHIRKHPVIEMCHFPYFEELIIILLEVFEVYWIIDWNLFQSSWIPWNVVEENSETEENEAADTYVQSVFWQIKSLAPFLDCFLRFCFQSTVFR